MSPPGALARTGSERAMNCSGARERLELFVLGGLPEGERYALARHLESCAGCREACEEISGIVSGVRAAAGPVRVRRSLGDDVMAAVRREMEAARARPAWIRGMAAAVCLAVGATALGPAPDELGGREMWRFPKAMAEPASGAGAMAVRGRRLYFLGSDADAGRVAAVDADCGRVLWRSNGRHVGYLAADDERVYALASGKDRRLALVAMDASDGRPLWHCESDEIPGIEPPCRPVPVWGGRVFWSVGRSLLVLEAGTGRVIRRHESTVGGGFSAPVVCRDRICAADAVDLLCLEVEGGEVAWSLSFGDRGRAAGRPLLAVGGRLGFVAFPDGGRECRLECVDLEGRKKIWSRSIPRPRHVLADGAALYVRGDAVTAIDGASGEIVWSRKISGCGPITAERDLLHLVDSRGEGRLVTLDRRDGREIRGTRGLRSCDAFVRGRGVGFIKTNDGVIRAFSF